MAKNHFNNQGFIQSLVESIQANIGNEHFGARELADAAGLSQRKLSLKLRTIKNTSVSCFIREIRLQKAFKILQTEDVTASEVAYKVGFSSATYFNKCFHEYYGFPPGKIRKDDFNISEKSNHVKKFAVCLSGKSFLKKVTYAFGSLIVIAGLLLIVNYNFINNSSEKQDMEKSPTVDLSAYDYYLKGNEELLQSWYPDYQPENIKRAEAFFRKAMEHDSAFAEAYIGLAYTYWQKLDRDLTISDNNILINYSDSMLILSDIALSHNPNLSGLYCIKASYYSFRGNKKEQALEANDKALRCNRNDWFATYQRGDLYSNISLVKAIEIAYKAAALASGIELNHSLYQIGSLYCMAGFPAIGNNYFLEAFKLERDSARYLFYLASIDVSQGDFKDSIEKYEKQDMKDNLDAIFPLNLGTCYLFLGQEKKALKYFGKYVSGNKVNERSAQSLYRYIGYAYWQNGYRKEANYYFKRTIEKNNSFIKYSLPVDYYDLAGVYAFMGEKDKAYDNLKIYSQKQCFSSIDIIYLKNDPLFRSIRNEPGFRRIVRNAESQFQAEHESVKKWLQKQGKL